MGYHTTFSGSVQVSPPLNQQEIDFLTKFNETRRMDRTKGPYYVDNKGMMGQDHEPDIRDYNSPPDGQPGLWCHWVPTADGTAIEWDGGEKFYDSPEWMQYLIDHFLGPNAKAKGELPFLQANHVLNGVIDAEGEEQGDVWVLVVKDNKVSTADSLPTYVEPPALPGPSSFEA